MQTKISCLFLCPGGCKAAGVQHIWGQGPPMLVCRAGSAGLGGSMGIPAPSLHAKGKHLVAWLQALLCCLSISVTFLWFWHWSPTGWTHLTAFPCFLPQSCVQEDFSFQGGSVHSVDIFSSFPFFPFGRLACDRLLMCWIQGNFPYLFILIQKVSQTTLEYFRSSVRCLPSVPLEWTPHLLLPSPKLGHLLFCYPTW